MENPIVAFRRPSAYFGRASLPVHVLVRAHQEQSIRNVLPNPLSPVMILRRGDKFISIWSHGPTFVNSSFERVPSWSGRASGGLERLTES